MAAALTPRRPRPVRLPPYHARLATSTDNLVSEAAQPGKPGLVRYPDNPFAHQASPDNRLAQARAPPIPSPVSDKANQQHSAVPPLLPSAALASNVPSEPALDGPSCQSTGRHAVWAVRGRRAPGSGRARVLRVNLRRARTPYSSPAAGASSQTQSALSVPSTVSIPAPKRARSNRRSKSAPPEPTFKLDQCSAGKQPQHKAPQDQPVLTTGEGNAVERAGVIRRGWAVVRSVSRVGGVITAIKSK